ncbi:MAG: ADP-ribosylglycohydrolase family protein [Anaerolineales bacterium]|nr:MAG: ADP-ribosylglycohydrolase family protein [Anaerolineales bacterium]
MDENLLDHIRGVAVGAAVGDALGMPLEFKPRRKEQDLVRDMLPGRIPAGTFTDDTEMALALGESLLYQLPLDPVDLSERFVAWMHGSPPDIGMHTRAVLQRMASGQDWNRAVADVQQAHPTTAGNGSVMRCWPVALVWWHHMPTLIQESVLQSQVTHPHPECIAGSAFVNATIAFLVQGMPAPDAVNQAQREVDMPQALYDAISQAPHQSRLDLPNSGWVRHTVESAVWGLLTTGDFESAVVQVVNLGNDADTAGAVVGAMAGAAYGFTSIPQRWRTLLQGEFPIGSGKLWNTGNFVQLADSLAKAGMQS